MTSTVQGGGGGGLRSGSVPLRKIAGKLQKIAWENCEKRREIAVLNFPPPPPCTVPALQGVAERSPKTVKSGRCSPLLMWRRGWDKGRRKGENQDTRTGEPFGYYAPAGVLWSRQGGGGVDTAV